MHRAFPVLFGLLMIACGGPDDAPGGVPQAVLDRPITGSASSRPGWTSIDYPQQYRAHGPALVVNLMAYLESEHEDDLKPALVGANRRESLLMLTAQLAADLEVWSAVPFLVTELERILPDDDTLVGSCLIAKLVELTQIEHGYRYHRRWFDESVQAEALADMKQWLRENDL